MTQSDRITSRAACAPKHDNEEKMFARLWISLLQMGDSEKMGEEERDQKIIEFFRAVFKTYDSDKAGTELSPIWKSNFKQMFKLIRKKHCTDAVILSY